MTRSSWLSWATNIEATYFLDISLEPGATCMMRRPFPFFRLGHMVIEKTCRMGPSVTSSQLRAVRELFKEREKVEDADIT